MINQFILNLKNNRLKKIIVRQVFAIVYKLKRMKQSVVLLKYKVATASKRKKKKMVSYDHFGSKPT